MKLGDEVPNFGPVQASTCKIDDWHTTIGDGWAILFSHPADFTPVCTTELAKAAALMDRFESRGVKVFALSIDSAESHRSWTADIESTGWSHGHSVSFPIIADTDGQIARAYEMFDPDEVDGKGNKLTARAVFFIKGKRLRASMLYPASSGRSFEEVLRVIDSLQLTDAHKVATPVEWKPGSKCMVLPTIPDAQAKDMFSDIEYVSVPSGKKYLRMVNDPSSPKGTLASMIKGSATHIAIALAGVLAGFMAGRRCSM